LARSRLLGQPQITGGQHAAGNDPESFRDGETRLLAQEWLFEAGVPYNKAMARSNKQ